MKQKVILALFSAALTLSFASELSAHGRGHDHPGHGHGHAYGHRKKHKVKKVYQYVYYPEQEVYYYPVQKRYYWREPAGWRFGVSLPGNIHLGASSHPVELETSRPYIMHETVRVKYR